jgi:hypothetical protein
MEYLAKIETMKYLSILVVLTLAISCGPQGSNTEQIIESNPFLIGKWSGEGKFMDVDLNKEMGEISIIIEIKEENVILGKIGEATMTNTSIDKADYGFRIRGTLDSKVKSDYGLDKDKVVVLLVLPKENRANIDSSEANFHLKSNFVFDFGMRVGGVTLKKKID